MSNPTASIPLQDHFSSQSAPLFFHLRDVDCIGNEHNLYDCEQESPDNPEDCIIKLDDAGVICDGMLECNLNCR